MRLDFGPRLRHPFYPQLPATPAAKARGAVIALWGTLSELEQAARSGVTARRAIFVTHHWDHTLLTDAQRDRLWDLFQTPIYAMLLDRSGNLVAYECEARSGLHMAGSETELAMCDCGRPGLRIAAERARAAITMPLATQRDRELEPKSIAQTA